MTGKEESRTARDFCRDLCRAGYNDDRVLAVASNTRWKAQLEEVGDWLKRRGDRWRQMGGRTPLQGSQIPNFRNYGRSSTQK